MSTVPASLRDELLDPLAQCFTPAVAQDVANLRFDSRFECKLESLRRKADEGTLTPVEQTEYEALIETFDFIATLREKSKRILKEQSRATLDEIQATRLTARDRDLFLKLLDAPPEPNEALQRAANRYFERRG